MDKLRNLNIFVNIFVECKIIIKFKSNSKGYEKTQRFYFYEIQDKVRQNIKKSFKQSNEVKKLKWLRIEDLSNHFTDFFNKNVKSGNVLF